MAPGYAYDWLTCKNLNFYLQHTLTTANLDFYDKKLVKQVFIQL